MRLSVPNNMWSNGAVFFGLLCLSVVPQLPGKLAGEPADLLSLKSNTAAFYNIDKQPYLCPQLFYPWCRIQNTSTCCLLKTALLAIVLHFHSKTTD